MSRLRRIVSYARPYGWRLALAVVGLAAAAGLGLVPPWALGRILDEAALGAPVGRLFALLVVVYSAASLIQGLSQYGVRWVGERAVTDLRLELHRHLLSLDLAFFRQTRSGDLLSRLGADVARIQGVIGQDLLQAIRALVVLVGGVSVLAWTDSSLLLLMLLTVPPLSLLTWGSGRIVRRLSLGQQATAAEASGDLAEGFGVIDLVKACSREGFEAERYAAGVEGAFALFVQQARAQTAFQVGAGWLAQLALVLVLWAAVRRVSAGTLTAGEVASFFVYTIMISSSVTVLTRAFGRVAAALGATERVFELLDQVPEVRDPEDPSDLGRARGALRFEGVHFAYTEGGLPVLAEVDLALEPGQVCALVGASGAGKSTLVHLALRFWDPDQGRVTLDGHDLRDLRKADVRGAMALVSQSPKLLSGSIRENIRYGRLDATDSEVEEAARAAHVDAFARELPEGYDTPVGEGGVKLSGGQRQRISIARALLRDPQILLLDEATSALDIESEALVRDALEVLQHGRTTLVVAHRPSTVRGADQIFVLEGGRVVEQGQHHYLLGLGGVYTRIFGPEVERQGGAG